MTKSVHIPLVQEQISLFKREEWDSLMLPIENHQNIREEISSGILRHHLCTDLSFTGKYEMPVVKAISCPIPKTIGAYYRIRNQYSMNIVPHFYTQDRKFEDTWSHPFKFLKTLIPFPYIIGTDFSVYDDLLFSEKLWNIFRNKLLSAWWQYHGIKVIPNISWINGKDYAISFDGWPRHSVIAVNSTGVGHKDRCKAMWLEGYKVMLDTLEPTHILRYGSKLEGEYEKISTYYSNDNKTFTNNGWQQFI